MKGIVFNLLEEVVTTHVGESAWDKILAHAGADGAYTSLGNYADGDFANLVGVLARASKKTDRQVLAWFGRHAMPFLSQRYPEFFTSQRGLRGFLLSLNAVIHAEVRKLYPGADVPEFEFETPPGEAAHDTLIIHYRSKRRLCALAEGFIAGAADHFREKVAVSQPKCMLDGAPECVIECRFERHGGP
ncbi:MAG: heme NO-binding domain-containing protein [Gammaproteobacteria bacterium]